MATKSKLTLYVDSTYGFVVRSLENEIDGALLTFGNRPAFRVVVRKVQEADSFLTLEPGPSSQVPWRMLIEPSERTVSLPPIGPSDTLGQRTELYARFVFGPFPGAGSTFLYVDWVASFLDSQRDRVRFSLVMRWGTSTEPFAVFWAAPIALQMDPLPKDRYFIAANGGAVTESPTADGGLRGDGSSYRFAAASRFEPEINSSDVDTLEAFYPGVLSMDVSAYGSRSLDDSIVIHGDLSGRGARVRDLYDGVSIILMHEVLCQDAVVVSNDGADGEFGSGKCIAVHRYVAAFKAIGEVFGEEVAIKWRRWLLSSVEGQAILPSRARDRSSEMGNFTLTPAWLEFDSTDLEAGTLATKQIADEWREIVAAPWSDHLVVSSSSWLDFAQQDNSATHPSSVGDVLPDLFDLQADPEKRNYMVDLRSTKGMLAVGYCRARRPEPFDGSNYWQDMNGSGAAMDLCRVKDHREAVSTTYKTTVQQLAVLSLVAEIVVADGYTFIRPFTVFDKAHWDHYTTYAKGTHASHSQHLGLIAIVHGVTTYYYPIERVDSARFNLNFVAVAGDVSANVSVPDIVQVIFFGDHEIPGYQGGTAFDAVAKNSLCCFADDYGSGAVSPLGGPFFRMVERIGTLFSEYLAADAGGGLVLLDLLQNPVCWEKDHNAGGGLGWTHTRGGSEQMAGLRNVLQKIREVISASNGGQWILLSDGGPTDYLMGKLDGTSETFRKMSLTTSKGTWGLSPFWATALGDFVRAGHYQNGGLGHVTGQFGAFAYSFYETGGLSRFVREAVLADWMHCRKLITIGHGAGPAGVMGVRSNGENAYTPFNHATYGQSNTTSIAALMASLLQVQRTFGHGNFHGQRVRSLQRLGTATDASNIGFLGFQAHDIGSHEQGATRPYLMHCAWADPTKRRKIVAVIANPHTSVRGDSFRFRPNWYKGLIPGRTGPYRVTRYVFTPTSVASEDKGIATGFYEISEKLEASGVVAYTFEFLSGLRFRFRYDDNDFEEIEVAHQLTRARVEPITGQGARFQFGFSNDQPDEDVRIAAMDLRVFTLGRSENK